MTYPYMALAFVAGFCFCLVLGAWLQDRDEKRHNPFKGRK